MKNNLILSIDPGREKTGFAVADSQGTILHHQWVYSPDFDHNFRNILQTYPIQEIIVGDRTDSAEIRRRIAALGTSQPIRLVDESFSSLEAKKIYWRYHDPSNIKEWLFRAMNFPAGPLDDLAAIILAWRYLKVTP